MARIAGVDIPRDKRVVISLTYIFGIGTKTAMDICKAADVNIDTRVCDLSNDELDRLRKEVDKIKVEVTYVGISIWILNVCKKSVHTVVCVTVVVYLFVGKTLKTMHVPVKVNGA